MNEVEKQNAIIKYLESYNAFDIDGMISVIHPDIEFKTERFIESQTSVD